MKTLPRLVGAALRERLRVMPAVVVTGAQQTGQEHARRGFSWAGAGATDYPEDTPCASRLVLGWRGDRPLHVVAA